MLQQNCLISRRLSFSILKKKRKTSFPLASRNNNNLPIDNSTRKINISKIQFLVPRDAINFQEGSREGRDTHTHTVSQRPDSTNAGVLWLVVGGPASRLSIEMRTDARISRFPPRNIIAATSVASDSSRTLLADGARNSRGRVHQLPRLSPGRGGDRFLGGRSDLSRFSLERHSNRPRYRDHRCGPDASRVTRFVLCVFSQSCLKARLHLLLMPCCSISFIDTIKPREERVYFILFLGSFSNKWKEI